MVARLFFSNPAPSLYHLALSSFPHPQVHFATTTNNNAQPFDVVFGSRRLVSSRRLSVFFPSASSFAIADSWSARSPFSALPPVPLRWAKHQYALARQLGKNSTQASLAVTSAIHHHHLSSHSLSPTHTPPFIPVLLCILARLRLALVPSRLFLFCRSPGHRLFRRQLGCDSHPPALHPRHHHTRPSWANRLSWLPASCISDVVVYY